MSSSISLHRPTSPKSSPQVQQKDPSTPQELPVAQEPSVPQDSSASHEQDAGGDLIGQLHRHEIAQDIVARSSGVVTSIEAMSDKTASEKFELLARVADELIHRVDDAAAGLHPVTPADRRAVAQALLHHVIPALRGQSEAATAQDPAITEPIAGKIANVESWLARLATSATVASSDEELPGPPPEEEPLPGPPPLAPEDQWEPQLFARVRDLTQHDVDQWPELCRSIVDDASRLAPNSVRRRLDVFDALCKRLTDRIDTAADCRDPTGKVQKKLQTIAQALAEVIPAMRTIRIPKEEPRFRARISTKIKTYEAWRRWAASAVPYAYLNPVIAGMGLRDPGSWKATSDQVIKGVQAMERDAGESRITLLTRLRNSMTDAVNGADEGDRMVVLRYATEVVQEQILPALRAELAPDAEVASMRNQQIQATKDWLHWANSRSIGVPADLRAPGQSRDPAMIVPRSPANTPVRASAQRDIPRMMAQIPQADAGHWQQAEPAWRLACTGIVLRINASRKLKPDQRLEMFALLKATLDARVQAHDGAPYADELCGFANEICQSIVIHAQRVQGASPGTKDLTLAFLNQSL